MDGNTRGICVILNPAAAKGRAGRIRKKAEQQLSMLGDSHRLYTTSGPLNACGLARAAAEDGFSLVVAAGGDGTVNEVVCGLMSAGASRAQRPKLGILPVGRGNDFAFAAGVPRDPATCWKLIAEGVSSPVDIGRVTGGLYPEGRYFVNGVGIGFEPLVTMTAGEFKRISGVPSYILALLKVMARYPKAVDIEMAFSGEERKVSTQQVSVCNGRRMGGAFLMGPDAIVDDGLLDLSYVNRPVSMGMILKLVGKFFRGTQKQHPFVSSALVDRIELNAPLGGLVCHADGETVTKNADRLVVEIFPGALELVRQ